MRFKLPSFEYPSRGDTKIKEKFLFFPKCIDGEVRWLEHAKYMVRYITSEYIWDHWSAVKWMDESED